MIRTVGSTESKITSLQWLVLSCALLAIVLACAAMAIAAVLHRGLTAEAWTAAVVGGSVCWLAAVLALVATYVGNRWHAPLQGLLVSMLFRMGLPLVSLILLPKFGGAAGAAGVTSTILGVYLVALAVETGLALRMVPTRPVAAAIKV